MRSYRQNLKKLKHENYLLALLMAVMTSFAQSKEGRSRTPQRANRENDASGTRNELKR
jgi:hypothetical protein